MATKKKQQYSDDGDGAHWESAREKERVMKAPRKSGIYVQQEKITKKRVTPTDSNSSAKYTGKGKTNRKRIATKK